jgi:hypothetical protein
MNYPSTIIVAAGLVAGALVFSSQGSPQTSGGSVGRYAIVPTSGGFTGGGVWRVDTVTGAVIYCGVPSTVNNCRASSEPSVPAP